METITATEAKQKLGTVLEAAQRGPIMICKQNREVAVVLSPMDYARLKGLGLQEFDRFCDRIGEQAAVRGLNEAKLAALLEE